MRCGSAFQKGGQSAQALGRSKGGFSTKVHASVDALGNPLKFILTAGQEHDITRAEALICDIECERVVADKGYDSDAFREYVAQSGATAVIPPKRNRQKQYWYDEHIYKERHLVECFFNKAKQFRRVFSRFDKYADSYLSFLHIAAALIWLK